ncbi:hypothetical protein AKJ16_DCAP07753 [Drosera capensis]
MQGVVTVLWSGPPNSHHFDTCQPIAKQFLVLKSGNLFWDVCVDIILVTGGYFLIHVMSRIEIDRISFSSRRELIVFSSIMSYYYVHVNAVLNGFFALNAAALWCLRLIVDIPLANGHGRCDNITTHIA